MFDGIGFVEERVGVRHDILWLKCKSRKVAEAGAAVATLGPLLGEAEFRESGKVIEPLLHKISRRILLYRSGNFDAIHRLRDVHVISRLECPWLPAGKEFFTLSGAHNDPEPSGFLPNDPSRDGAFVCPEAIVDYRNDRGFSGPGNAADNVQLAWLKLNNPYV